MKVFFTLDSLANAGTEKSTLDILSHFSKDIEVKVIHFFPGFDLKDDYEKAGIPLHYAGLSGKREFVKGTRSLIRLIKTEKPDLIVSSIMRANFYSRFAGIITGTTLIGTFVNDSYGALRIEEMKRKKQYLGYRIFWLLDKYTSWIPKYWISNAISIAQSNIKALGISKGKTKVIYRGREIALFPPYQPSIDKSVFKFVFVGRLLERKGLGELLEAVKIVMEKYPDIKLDIFGDGLYRKKVQTFITNLQLQDTVSLHGKVPNGWKRLYDADCFVFPSWYEGFSGALVEAMAVGIPIIASDIPMNMEAVNTNTALIYPVKDTNKLVAQMVRVIEEYPQMIEMGKRARAEAAARFDIRQIAAQYESFLKEVVNRKVEKATLI